MTPPHLTLVVNNDAPLRLARAAEIAFPDGSMTASGLRKEAAKGRLVIERIANKDYTTLAAIADMRAACRNPVPNQSRSGPGRLSPTAGRVALESLLLNVKRQTGGKLAS
jgi:hypothetical protein